MWARVYLQQNNEPISVSQQQHVWYSDGPDAILYSLEANYAVSSECGWPITRTAVSGMQCCTSNFNFGWPRFIQKMIHVAPDGGAAISLLGPVMVSRADQPLVPCLAVFAPYTF
jgi:hypothetical protein